MSAAFCCEDWGASGGWRGVHVICFPPPGNLDNLGALTYMRASVSPLQSEVIEPPIGFLHPLRWGINPSFMWQVTKCVGRLA